MTFLVLLIIFFIPSSSACDQGWYAYKQEKCLFYDPVNVNFEKAVTVCSDKNATLASIGSKEEQDFILSLGRLHYTLSGVHWVWLGLTRNINDPLLFNWKDGSLFNYSNWRDGCPDTRPGENCVLMTVFRDRPSHWCNFRCDSNFDHVICQKEWSEGGSTTPLPAIVTPPKRRPGSRFPPRRPWFPDIPMESQECDFGWDFKFNKCYKFILSNVTGEEARYYCRRFGGDAQPLTISSEAEQSWAVDFAFFKNEAKEAVWLGALRVGPENNSIKWRDGRDMVYANWSPHEPDNRNNSENCVAMNDIPKFFGMWLDAPCTLKFHLICEKTAKIIVPLNVSDNVLDNVISGNVDDSRLTQELLQETSGSSGLFGFMIFVIVVLSLLTAFFGYTVLDLKKQIASNLRESRVNIYYASASEEPEYEEPKYSVGSFSSPYATTTSSITYAPGTLAQE